MSFHNGKTWFVFYEQHLFKFSGSSGISINLYIGGLFLDEMSYDSIDI